ncbi:glycosyl transferase, group 1 [Pyrobaculum islandicum DSM 4184]|uniref:Glycosyl transferase, group 1 n=1 Tax=Pyrobaculum islandicum (strain DSM 4184 / JCM 9189 / GEO3) TaxID=384616 RepID=A1RUM3_PYRIL|nr:glycosyltransferase family 4 protein [Pyrobaculum islandicum]ABL88655.1 glycosyl transferase, group 1 [Pyrobaculum islandicum DSM 4184]
MRIVGFRASSSGIATYTAELAKALARVDRVVLVAFGIDRSLKSELVSKGVSVLDLGPDPGWRFDVGGPFLAYGLLRRRVRRALGEGGYAVYTIPGFALGERRPGIVVAWGHLGFWQLLGVGAKWLPHLFKFVGVPNTSAYWLLDNWVFRRAETIVALTSWSFRHYSRRYGDRVVWIPPPVEPAPCSSPGDRLRLVFVSRDLGLPRKNLALVVRALSGLGPYLKKMSLTLVGEGGGRLADLVSRLRGRGLEVRLTGRLSRSETRRVLCSSDVLLYPSFYEELGYAVLEAMAAGLAVVASNVPPFDDFVAEGINGFLVDPVDPKPLSRVLAELVEHSDLLIKLKANSLSIVKNRFNPLAVARQFQKIILGKGR